MKRVLNFIQDNPYGMLAILMLLCIIGEAHVLKVSQTVQLCTVSALAMVFFGIRKTWVGVVGMSPVFVATLFCVFVPCTHAYEVREWGSATYRGELGPNTVEIDEVSRSDGSFRRIVHVQPQGRLSYVSITGHSGRAIGHWQRVFYCGLPTSELGCNSVEYNDQTGVWDFVPCPADQGKVKPFTDEQILYAIGQLNQAMASVYNPEHRVAVHGNGAK